MPSDFRDDYYWSYDAPDDDATLAEKLAYQRKLREFWESCEIPSRLPYARANANWWELPYAIDSAAIARQQLRRLKRQNER
jgi:hypothetical protein